MARAMLAGALLWIGVSADALTPIAQDRHVFGRHEDGFGNLEYVLGLPGTEMRSASDYAPFSASIDGYSLPPQVGEDPDIVAAQSSTIGADRLDASGNSESSPFNAIDGNLIIGESVYSVTFEVETARSYALTGQIDVVSNFCEGSTEARIRLSGPGGTLAQVSRTLDGYVGTSGQDSIPLSTTLLLPAGTYALEARSRTEGFGGYGTHTGPMCAGDLTGHYEVHLAPAAPAVPALPGVLIPFLALSLALSARAAQALTPTSQERRVQVAIDAQPILPGVVLGESVSAPDFEPFAAGVDGLPTPPFPVLQTTVQNSTIGANALHATGGFDISAGSGSVGSYVREQPSSVYVVSFEIAEPTPYTLTGVLELELDGCDAHTQGRIRLTGPGGVLVSVEERFSGYPDPDLCIDCRTSLPLDASGVLAPGSYTLDARVSGSAYEAFYPGDVCDGAIASAAYSAHLLAAAPQVPALPTPWNAALATALALAARRVRLLGASPPPT
jgi:hypothetical protein